ncbi:Hypothetical_protein [Hexamita inflata]|uniref:Hypothetical_protein n=1 Tax=Hexamita inflata TaxID=28002 RepID=A0AA86PAQ2_9EUKA|nr:Hypothetical protein HINF_LOCUS20890 [Hexamita inflata]
MLNNPSTLNIFLEATQKQNRAYNITTHQQNVDYQWVNYYIKTNYANQFFKPRSRPRENIRVRNVPTIYVYAKYTLDALYCLSSNDLFMNQEPASMNESPTTLLIKLIKINVDEVITVPSSSVQTSRQCHIIKITADLAIKYINSGMIELKHTQNIGFMIIEVQCICTGSYDALDKIDECQDCDSLIDIVVE